MATASIMDVPAASRRPAGHGRFPTGDVIAISGMALVAMAFGVGLFVEGGYELFIAASAGGLAFVLLLAQHVLVRPVIGLEAATGAGRLVRRRPAPRSAEGEGGNLRAPADLTAGPAVAPIPPPLPPGPDAARAGAVGDAAADEGLAGPSVLRVAPAAAEPAADPLIRELIERIAADINAGRRLGGAPLSGDQGAHQVRATELQTSADTPAEQVLRAVPPPLPKRDLDADSAVLGPAMEEAVLDGRIEELRTTADAMREAIGEPATASRGKNTTSPADRAVAVADSLAGERYDVLLEPILGLQSQSLEHYELVIRLRNADDTALEHDGVPAGGLMPLIDAIRVHQAVRVVRDLEASRTSGAMLSSFAGESLVDREFLKSFAQAFEACRAISGRLVLSFAQADVAVLGPAQWRTLTDMARYGFRFAMRDITHLDMDFEAARASGFEFARIDADVLLEGLPVGTGVIAPGDVCRHIAGQGLAVIVGRIEDEKQLVRVLGFGAAFGQGTLFGGVRLVHKSGVAAAA